MKTFLRRISWKSIVSRVTPCIRTCQRKAVGRNEFIWRFAGLRMFLEQKFQFRAGGATGSERSVQYAVILQLDMCNSSDTNISVPTRLITINVGIHVSHLAAKVFSRLFMIHVWHCNELLAPADAGQCPNTDETARNILGDNTAPCSNHSAQLQSVERCIYSREFFPFPFSIEGCGWVSCCYARGWVVKRAQFIFGAALSAASS